MLANNKKAYHDYFVLEELEAGIELIGPEVKSLRQNNASFNNAFIDIEGGEAYIYGLHIKPYSHGNIWNGDPDRKRRLLLHKKEILKLMQQRSEKGCTIVPLELYFSNGRVKVKIALCKGKKLYDKRATIKERDIKRDAERDFNRR